MKTAKKILSDLLAFICVLLVLMVLVLAGVGAVVWTGSIHPVLGVACMTLLSVGVSWMFEQTQRSKP